METNQNQTIDSIIPVPVSIESFIHEHMDDFVKGIDTDYIKTNMIKQLPEHIKINTVFRALNNICNKKRIYRNGKKLMTYKLESEMIKWIEQ